MEILPFIDVAGGKSQRFETKNDVDDVLRVTTGKPQKVLHLVARDKKKLFEFVPK